MAEKDKTTRETTDKTTGEITDKRKPEFDFIFKATFIAVVIITIITVVSILIIAFIMPQKSVQLYEADLMAVGLGIIGIAISVWAGLNIANSIERKDVENIKISVKEIQKEFANNKKEIGTVKTDIDSAKKDVKSINDDVEAMNNEKLNLYWKTFQSELLNTNQDTVSRYFYTKFSAVGYAEWNSITEMILLEQDFSQIYNNYSETSKVKKILLDKSGDSIIRAKELLKKIDAIKVEKLKELVEIYLKYRITEFHFMNGYMVEKKASYHEFKEAANGFEEICKLIEIDLEHVYEISEEIKELAVYFANSIGESYSKVTHRGDIPKDDDPEEKIMKFREEVNPYSEKAIRYLSLAVELNEQFSQREVYYRNLGCAYERKDRNNKSVGENAKNIIFNYRKALDAVISSDEDKTRVQKIYYVLLSYYHVVMKVIFKIDDKENNVFSNLQRFEAFKAEVENKVIDEDTKKYLYDFIHVSELAVLDNPRFSLNRLMYGFSMSWLIIMLLTEKVDIKSMYNANAGVKDYLSKIEECLSTVEAMHKNDDYYKELKKRYEILTEYCNKK